MRTPEDGGPEGGLLAAGLAIRTGRVKRDRRGREVGVVWDVDLSRLGDGVALWVALTYLQRALDENRANLTALGKKHLGLSSAASPGIEPG